MSEPGAVATGFFVGTHPVATAPGSDPLMLLAVDIGNSNIKFGIFDGEQLVSRFSIPTKSNLSFAGLKTAFDKGVAAPVSAIVACSVVPTAEPGMADFLRGYLGIEPVFVRNDFDFGLKINYEPVSSAGTDRLVNSFAASQQYGVPCIVCSFGTATTIDVVDKHGTLTGGIIAPGMETMIRALNQNTARLPVVDIAAPPTVVGTTTAAAIQSGIFYGHVSMVEGLIGMIENEIGDRPKVIATGGFSALLARRTNRIDVVNENLTFQGLKAIHLKLAYKNLK